MRMNLGRKQLEKILIFSIFIVTLYLSGTILVAIVNENDTSKKLSILLLLMLGYFVLRSIAIMKWRNSLFLFAICTFGFFLVNYINYTGTADSLMMRTLWFFAAYAMYRYAENRGIVVEEVFYHAVLLIAWITLVYFVLIEIFKLSLPYTTIGSGGIVYRNYHNLYFNTDYYIRTYFGFQFHRLHGLFWEPGVYQIFLNFALFYALLRKKDKNKTSIAILLINVILTVSTTGLIISVCLVSYALYNSKKFRRYRMLVVVPVFLTAVVLSYNIWMEKVITGAGSYLARVSDLTIGLQLFFQNFILGTGYDNVQIFTRIQARGRGSTNGLVTWCYTMGIVGVVACILPFILNILFEKNKEEKMNRIIYFGIFILCNMSEPIYFAPLMWMIVAGEYWKLKGGIVCEQHITKPSP